MKKLIVVIMASFLILGGCSQSNQEKAKESAKAPQAIEAILQVPETLEASEEAFLAVTVKHGNEAVTDADEVKFEVWKEGKKEEGEMIEAKHDKEGKYTADYAFADEGIYYVQSHVTARSQHTMPKVSIQVGDMKAENTGHDHEHEEEGHEESHSHSNGGAVSIELHAPDHIHAKEQTALSVMLGKAGEPLTDAKAKLEISLEGSTPQWVNLSETERGNYTADHQFSETGTYIITIHVEKGDDLHEHTETKLTIK